MTNNFRYIGSTIGRYRGYILLFLASLLLFSCADTPLNSNSRQWPVYCEVDLNSSMAKPLLSPSGYIRITEPILANTAIGLGGLLLVRGPVEEVYYAYDLSCPVEQDKDTKIIVNDMLDAECPKCKSTFSILYGGGAPTGGVARVNLTCYRAYRTRNLVIISNR